MKKHLKIIFSLFIVVLILSCSSKKTEEPVQSVQQQTIPTSEKKNSEMDSKDTEILSKDTQIGKSKGMKTHPEESVKEKSQPLPSENIKTPSPSTTANTNMEVSAESKIEIAVARTTPEEVHILYWSTWEACMEPLMQSGKNVGGFVYLASMIKKRTDPQETLVLCTGDLMVGDTKDQRPVVPALNLAGISATALGNLELNFGPKELKKQLAQANFSVLSCNVYQGDTTLFPPWTSKQVKDVRVGIIGVTTQEAAIQVAPAMLQGLVFRDPLKETEKCIEQMAGKTDLVIVLSNLRHEEDIKLAQKCPGIHLILGRYDVNPDHTFTKVGNALIARVHKKQGTQLGEVVVKKENGQWNFYPQIYQIGPDTEDCKGISLSPESRKLIEEWHEREKELVEVLCETKVNLDGDYQVVRQQETNFGNLMADILLESRPGADAAFINSGCIRATIPKGNITYGMLLVAMPYKNKIVELSVKGDTIKEMLENSVAQYEKVSGAFLQVGGLSYAFDPSQEKFSRVSDIKIQDEPLDRQKDYRIIITDYMATGGDDYVMLKDKPSLYTSIEPLHEIIRNYLKQKHTIQTEVEGRIRKISK